MTVMFSSVMTKAFSYDVRHRWRAQPATTNEVTYYYYTSTATIFFFAPNYIAMRGKWIHCNNDNMNSFRRFTRLQLPKLNIFYKHRPQFSQKIYIHNI